MIADWRVGTSHIESVYFDRSFIKNSKFFSSKYWRSNDQKNLWGVWIKKCKKWFWQNENQLKDQLNLFSEHRAFIPGPAWSISRRLMSTWIVLLLSWLIQSMLSHAVWDAFVARMFLRNNQSIISFRSYFGLFQLWQTFYTVVWCAFFGYWIHSWFTCRKYFLIVWLWCGGHLQVMVLWFRHCSSAIAPDAMWTSSGFVLAFLGSFYQMQCEWTSGGHSVNKCWYRSCIFRFIFKSCASGEVNLF